MRQSSDGRSANSSVWFVSSNRHKYDEACATLEKLGICASHIRSELLEIQSDSLVDVARSKARDASARFGRPVLVEDDGMFVDGLNGFPGVYSSFVLGTIGLDGILRLLMPKGTSRRARFVAAVAYDDGGDGAGLRTFEAQICGAISAEPRGDGWGYDPIFVPDGCAETFAEMGAEDKIGMSHRSMALAAFADWYLASGV